MPAAVIYESMFGNTRKVAEAVADGLRESGDVVVMRANDATTPSMVADVDLVVVGAPTHVHGLSRASSRDAALQMAAKPDAHVSLEPDAAAPGVREWLASLGNTEIRAAAFDTRQAGPRFFTGSAARKIRRELRKRGAKIAAPVESFVVRKNQLVDGELDRARVWGARLVTNRMSGQPRP
jgi:flavodoxin